MNLGLGGNPFYGTRWESLNETCWEKIFVTCWDYLYMGLVGVSCFWDLLGSISRLLENFLLELLGLYHTFFETCWRYSFTGLVGINFYKTCRDYTYSRDLLEVLCNQQYTKVSYVAAT